MELTAGTLTLAEGATYRSRKRRRGGGSPLLRFSQMDSSSTIKRRARGEEVIIGVERSQVCDSCEQPMWFHFIRRLFQMQRSQPLNRVDLPCVARAVFSGCSCYALRAVCTRDGENETSLILFAAENGCYKEGREGRSSFSHVFEPILSSALSLIKILTLRRVSL